jgi:DNA polymerase sigma
MFDINVTFFDCLLILTLIVLSLQSSYQDMKALPRMVVPPFSRIGAAVVDYVKPLLKLDDPGLINILETHKMLSELSNSALSADHMEGTLYTFGSATVYGVQEIQSDVDYVLLTKDAIADGQGQDTSTQQAKAFQAHILSKLAQEIRSKQPMWQVEEVKRTRVPVIRVKNSKIPFDISVDRRNGVRNSILIRSYFNQFPEARWLAMGVKHWSKRCGMNGPMGYLTSYGFNILVVFYLMQRNLVKFVPIETTDVAHVSPLPTPLPLEEPDVGVLGEQIVDFLRFYLDEFDLDRNVVSLSRTDMRTKDSMNWTKVAEDMKALNGEGKISYRLSIEDPYEVNLNVGRNVSAFKYDMMRRHFNKALGDGLGFIPPS